MHVMRSSLVLLTLLQSTGCATYFWRQSCDERAGMRNRVERGVASIDRVLMRRASDNRVELVMNGRLADGEARTWRASIPPSPEPGLPSDGGVVLPEPAAPPQAGSSYEDLPRLSAWPASGNPHDGYVRAMPASVHAQSL